MTVPIRMRWDGEVQRPINSTWAKRAAAQWTIGVEYDIDAQEPRSVRSHNHFFASIADVWGTLPERLAERFPNAEALRKHALIRTGYRDERSFVCNSKAEAIRLAAFVRPMDDYAIVVVSEAVVIVYTAKSQSRKAMGCKAFQQSKQDVLDFLDQMIGVERGASAQNAEEVA